MCGIAGAFAYRTADLVDLRELERAWRRMSCRGPDGAGIETYATGRVALAHRRLAIIDLTTRGAQPMRTANGRLAIVLNGEIYNYRALRAELQRKGYAFASDSDTEVLLHLYADRGAAMLGSVRGMFAFAIWDADARRLFLARDPFGIKPLYVADDGTRLRFASEVKALVAGGGIDTSPEPAGHVGFFLWGHVPEPYTMYRGVRALPAGTYMEVDERGVSTHSYASVTDLLSDAERDAARAGQSDDARAAAAIRAALYDSVAHHLVADVPVGVFLSAGIDSSTLLALAAETGGQLRTLTVGFDEFRGTRDDETVVAASVARQYGAEHLTSWMTREQFRADLGCIMERMDQPTTDGVNTFCVARAAARAGLTVALSGLGGDELFGGYPSFTQVGRLVGAMGAIPGGETLGRGLRIVSTGIVKRFTSPKYAAIMELGRDFGGAYLLRRGLFLPWEITDVLDVDMVRAGLTELQTRGRLAVTADALSLDRMRITALETSWYMRSQLLRDTDWASMSHSLEVRVPLVDWHLWRAVMPLLARRPPGKAWLSQAARPPLPAAVTRRAKTGFATPVRAWLADIGAARGADRGLRGWARYVHKQFAT